MKIQNDSNPPDLPVVPHRAASWWATLEDLQWPQKKIAVAQSV